MRRGLRAAALVMALVLLLGTVAAATDTTETTGSIYDAANVAKKNGIQVAPLDGCTVKFAEGSEMLTVTYTNEKLNVNDMVIVLLLKSDKAVTSDTEAKDVKPTLTAGTIQYIDQADVETAGTVTFRVFPQNYSNGVIRVIASRTTEGKTETVLNEPVAAVNRTYTLGDVNDDKVIDMQDVSDTLLYVVGKKTSGVNENAADVDQNGKLDVQDVSDILMHVIKNVAFRTRN